MPVDVTPVQAGVDIDIPAGGFPLASDEFVIFTVPGTDPARIESVYCQAVYSGADIQDWYVLRFYDQSGKPLFAVSTGYVSED